MGGRNVHTFLRTSRLTWQRQHNRNLLQREIRDDRRNNSGYFVVPLQSQRSCVSRPAQGFGGRRLAADVRQLRGGGFTNSLGSSLRVSPFH